MLSPQETRAIFGRPLESLAQLRRNQVSANITKTEHILRHWSSPTETHLLSIKRELNKKRHHENTQLTHAKEYLRLFGGVYRRIPPKAQSKVPFRV